MSQEAFFLSATQGDRFCLFSPVKEGDEKGALIYIHPFAEELNKTRRMAALQVRALAEAGYAVLQIDLFGCGDSGGDFGDATWAGWMEDVHLAYLWLKRRSQAPIWLWGLRAGCLIAADAARILPDPVNFIFWQPVTSGALALQQFLRLAVAAEALDGGGRGVMASLRGRLEQDQAVEVGGYSLSPALAKGLQNAELSPPVADSTRLLWIEISNRDGNDFFPASANLVQVWRQADYHVSEKIVAGPAFWQTAEIEIAQELLTTTVQGLGTLR